LASLDSSPSSSSTSKDSTAWRATGETSERGHFGVGLYKASTSLSVTCKRGNYVGRIAETEADLQGLSLYSTHTSALPLESSSRRAAGVSVPSAVERLPAKQPAEGGGSAILMPRTLGPSGVGELGVHSTREGGDSVALVLPQHADGQHAMKPWENSSLVGARGVHKSPTSSETEDELDLGIDLSELDDLDVLAPPSRNPQAMLEVRALSPFMCDHSGCVNLQQESIVAGSIHHMNMAE
jgi:hypothetical protein